MEGVGVILAGVWAVLGIWGTFILWRKRYLGFFRVVADLGCLGWIIYGWIVALIIIILPIYILIFGGGITLLIAKSLHDKVPPTYTYQDQRP